MPITPAHPAAVLPLARTRLVFSALVVGSMAPDFPYFVMLSAHPRFGHTIPGLFWFCVPVGLVVLLAFHRFVKRPLMACLPAAHRERLRPAAEGFRLSSAPDWVLTVASLAIGAFTHVAWDSVTHRNGWTVQRVTLLQRTAFVFAGHAPQICTLLQYVCSILGMALLAWFCVRWRPTAVTAVTGKCAEPLSES